MKKMLIPVFVLSMLLLAILFAGCTTTPPVLKAPVNPTVPGVMTRVTASGQNYPAYLAVASAPGKHPGLVLIHSFNGLEQGYKTMCDQIAADGYVVIAPEWQTFNQSAGDPEVEALIRSSVATLTARPDVDPARLGLTGFCAGGRFTMLFLPQVKEFKSGVAWYGFPYSRGYTNNTQPAEHIGELSSPMLMIHGSRDMASPVTDIFNYTKQLDAANKYFELKEYQGQPHGFMIVNGSLNTEDYAKDAYGEMIRFFNRTL